MDRRAFLGMGLTGAAGAVVGATGALAAEQVRGISEKGAVGTATVPFYGAHQSGIETPSPSNATIVAFTLRSNTDPERLQRLLRLWSSDAALLQTGQPSMGDTASELAKLPASLTITIGLGWGAFVAGGVTDRWPVSHQAIPAFPEIDALEPRWCDGDLLLQVCGNDATTVLHAVRELTRDAAPFAVPKWQMSGWMPRADVNPGETARNLMGFKDGTVNPAPGSDSFAKIVWNTGAKHEWFAGGTTVAIRRIRMNLDLWDTVPPLMQEAAFGRHMVNGAPLGGTSEFQNPDLKAVDAKGALVIPLDSHMRRSRKDEKILRRPFNYDDGLATDGTPDAGLIFIAYAAELEQYLAIQGSLAKLDAMNTWTTPVGSAMFVVPPGALDANHWVGEGLFA